MDKIFLIRYGEIALKGQNKSAFEDKLVTQIHNAINTLGKFKISKSQSRIYVEPLSAINYNDVTGALKKVFGIVSLSIVDKVETDFDVICDMAVQHAKILFDEGKKTFKVESRRGDKSFKYNSMELSAKVGECILNNIPQLKVDVHNPEFILFIEAREQSYIYSQIIPGTGGMPIGTNGKATLLLSGGIDSPVAGYMISKRGVSLDAVHFYSFPYTSERAKDKVIELSHILAGYCGKVNLFVVPFTDIQMQIYQKCPDEQLTLIMRRFMMKIAERIAQREGSNALITGESLGQVASQTIQSLHVTNAVVGMPVFRPLIGMDKVEIIDIASKIGTFETSILPYEDCCTVFVPKHPKTKPQIEKIILSESHLDVEGLINEAVNNTELIKVTR